MKIPNLSRSAYENFLSLARIVSEDSQHSVSTPNPRVSLAKIVSERVQKFISESRKKQDRV